MSEKSYSQKKRDKFDYRLAYFKDNPGLFGCVWSCAYCHKPLLGKSSVVVDHIIPLNSMLGKNARFNLVASCEKCNLRKSDKLDYRIAKGYLAKAAETVVVQLQRLVVLAFVAVWWAAGAVFSCLAGAAKKAFRMLPLPVKICLLAAALIYLFKIERGI